MIKEIKHTMADNKQSFDKHYGLFQAWHGKTQVVTEEQIRRFNSEHPLCFSVIEESLFRANGQPSPFGKLIIAKRGEEESPIALNGKNYQIIQNDVFWSEFMNACSKVAGKVSYVGSVGGGAKTFATFEPAGGEWTASNGDKFTGNINAVNGHDGLTAFELGASTVRIVCQNTLQLYLANRKRLAKVYHTKNASKMLIDMREAVDTMFDAQAKMRDDIERLGNININVDTMRGLALCVVSKDVKPDDLLKSDGFSTRTLNQANEITNLFIKGRGNSGQNAFDALNAFTEYYTHGSKESNRDKADVFASSEFGTYAKTKADVYNRLTNPERFAQSVALANQLVRFA